MLLLRRQVIAIAAPCEYFEVAGVRMLASACKTLASRLHKSGSSSIQDTNLDNESKGGGSHAGELAARLRSAHRRGRGRGPLCGRGPRRRQARDVRVREWAAPDVGRVVEERAAVRREPTSCMRRRRKPACAPLRPGGTSKKPDARRFAKPSVVVPWRDAFDGLAARGRDRTWRTWRRCGWAFREGAAVERDGAARDLRGVTAHRPARACALPACWVARTRSQLSGLRAARRRADGASGRSAPVNTPSRCRPLGQCT